MSIPTVPTPPTDNLYKFVAISGVVLMIGAPVYWGTFYIALVQREAVAWQALRDFNPPYEYYVPNTMLPLPGITDEKQRQAELERIRERFDAKRDRLLRADQDFMLYDRLRNVVTAISIFAAGFGASLAYFGFKFWYARVQKFQDQILAKQAAQESKEST